MISFKKQRLPSESFTQPDTYRQIRLPVNQASTLIPDAYTSDDFFALEQENIFLNSWVAVGCLPQVSKQGDILVTEVAGRSILVIRSKEDKQQRRKVAREPKHSKEIRIYEHGSPTIHRKS